MNNDFYHQSILPHAAIIIKICRAYTDSESEFEDYYQEVCLQIWRSRDNFQKMSKWSTWIYRLSLNVCLTNLRKKKKTGDIEKPAAHGENAMSDLTPFSDEAVNELYKAIKQLSETDRAVILLYLEEKPYQEIAKIIGSNANNIGVRISRIKAKLNNILETKDK